MFDRTFVFPRVSGGEHHHHHTEKRAPTDESVKLLREMEKAAQDQVDKSIRLAPNGFECVVHAYYDMVGDDYSFRIHFSLNGQRHTAEYRQRRHDDPKGVGAGVLKAVSEEIARSAIPALADSIHASFGKSFFQPRVHSNSKAI